MTPTKEDLEVVAKTVWAEARGEGLTGMLCVAYVIKNRLVSGLWGNTLEKVCKAPYQFSCWNPDDSNRKVLDRWSWESKDPSQLFALGAVAAALFGLAVDPTLGATHYHTTAKPNWIPNVVWPPKWAAGMGKPVVIGHHSFYKDPRVN